MFTQILPIHYANGDILRKYLDQKFPGQQYTASADAEQQLDHRSPSASEPGE
ncbi:hypothetical protein CEP54_004023 [Fusarium duplospermum]|uniref:Uncharacterized protein n=1 Tax=Fusarium duplospermum TaxID=1325734 RepID=A0A428QKN9_9HYPO|nr:hypothetical protein CEP54_004023 [Fusarium duplospermum]